MLLLRRGISSSDVSGRDVQAAVLVIGRDFRFRKRALRVIENESRRVV